METNVTLPISQMMRLAQTYSKIQIAILFDPDFDAENNKHYIVHLYDKASELDDHFVINLLNERYDMMVIMNLDASGLPESTMDEAKQSFEEIYQFILNVVPKYDINLLKRRSHNRKLLGCERRHGGKSFFACFETERNGNVVFHVRKYLFRTECDNVRKLALSMGYPKEYIYDVVPSIIEWIIKQENMKTKVIDYLLKMPDTFAIPIEDVSDMMCGKIKITI